jgi:hypothetical protein
MTVLHLFIGHFSVLRSRTSPAAALCAINIVNNTSVIELQNGNRPRGFAFDTHEPLRHLRAVTSSLSRGNANLTVSRAESDDTPRCCFRRNGLALFRGPQGNANGHEHYELERNYWHYQRKALTLCHLHREYDPTNWKLGPFSPNEPDSKIRLRLPNMLSPCHFR